MSQVTPQHNKTKSGGVAEDIIYSPSSSFRRSSSVAFSTAVPNSTSVCCHLCALGSLGLLLIADCFQPYYPKVPLIPVIIFAIFLSLVSNAAVMNAGRQLYPRSFRYFQPFQGGFTFVLVQFWGYSTWTCSIILLLLYLKLWIPRPATGEESFTESSLSFVYKYGILSFSGILHCISSMLLCSSLSKFQTSSTDGSTSPTHRREASSSNNLFRSASSSVFSASQSGGNFTLSQQQSSQFVGKPTPAALFGEKSLVLILAVFNMALCVFAEWEKELLLPYLSTTEHKDDPVDDGPFSPPPNSLRKMICLIFLIGHLSCGALVHFSIGWRHTPNYRLFMPFEGGASAVLASALGWSLFSFPIYISVALVGTDAETSLHQIPFAFLIMGCLSVTSILFLLLFLYIWRLRVETAAVGSCGLSLLLSPVRSPKSQMNFGGSDFPSHRSIQRKLLAAYILSGLMTLHALVTILVISSKLLIHFERSAIWSLYADTLQRFRGLLMWCSLVISPLTHFVGRWAYGKYYSLYQPFEGTNEFVILQALGWSGYSVACAMLMGFSSDEPQQEEQVPIWLFFTMGFFTLGQLCLHGSLVVFQPLSTSATDTNDNIDLERDGNLTENERNEGPSGGGGNYGEFLVACLLSLISLGLLVLVDVTSSVEKQSTTSSSSSNATTTLFPRFRVTLIGSLFFLAATPLAQYSLRHKFSGPGTPSSSSVSSPLPLAQETVALQAVAWTMYVGLAFLTMGICYLDFASPHVTKAMPLLHTWRGILQQFPVALLITATLFGGPAIPEEAGSSPIMSGSPPEPTSTSVADSSSFGSPPPDALASTRRSETQPSVPSDSFAVPPPISQPGGFLQSMNDIQELQTLLSELQQGKKKSKKKDEGIMSESLQKSLAQIVALSMKQHKMDEEVASHMERSGTTIRGVTRSASSPNNNELLASPPDEKQRPPSATASPWWSARGRKFHSLQALGLILALSAFILFGTAGVLSMHEVTRDFSTFISIVAFLETSLCCWAIHIFYAPSLDSRYRVWMPFEGGVTFVMLHASGWSAYTTHVVLALWATISKSKHSRVGSYMACGVLAMTAQACLAYAPMFFDPVVQTSFLQMHAEGILSALLCFLSVVSMWAYEAIHLRSEDAELLSTGPLMVSFFLFALAAPLAIISLKKSKKRWQESVADKLLMEEEDDSLGLMECTMESKSHYVHRLQKKRRHFLETHLPPMQILEQSLYWLFAGFPLLLLFGLHYMIYHYVPGVATTLHSSRWLAIIFPFILLAVLFFRTPEGLFPKWIVTLRRNFIVFNFFMIPAYVPIVPLLAPIVWPTTGGFLFMLDFFALGLIPQGLRKMWKYVHFVFIGYLIYNRFVYFVTVLLRPTTDSSSLLPGGVDGGDLFDSQRTAATAVVNNITWWSSVLTSSSAADEANYSGDWLLTWFSSYIQISASLRPWLNFALTLLDDVIEQLLFFSYYGLYRFNPETYGTRQGTWFVRIINKWVFSELRSYFRFQLVIEEEDDKKKHEGGRKTGKGGKNNLLPSPSKKGGKLLDPPLYLHRRILSQPKQRYIFGFHPHGVLAASCIWFFINPEWEEKMGSATVCTPHAASILFQAPILRDLVLGCGARVVNKGALMHSLEEGNSVAIVPGGQHEMLHSGFSYQEVIVTTKHKGFIRLAVQQDLPLVPIFMFGEHNIVDNIRMYKVQSFFLKKLGAPFPVAPYGRWFLPLPNSIRLGAVVGQPIRWNSDEIKEALHSNAPFPRCPPSDDEERSSEGKQKIGKEKTKNTKAQQEEQGAEKRSEVQEEMAPSSEPTEDQIVEYVANKYYAEISRIFEKNKADLGYPNLKLVFKK